LTVGLSGASLRGEGRFASRGMVQIDVYAPMAMDKSSGKNMQESEYLRASALLCNCTAIRQAARHMTRFYDACLAEVGLRSTQYIVLLFLSRRGAVTMAALAAETVMDRTTMAHNLQPLEREGLVKIEIGKEDRRSRMLSLTKAGQRRVKDGQAAWQRAQDRFEAKFGWEKASEMRKIMSEVVETDLQFEVP
jgi:DNA-binding MarR family transcriptional regulator